MGGRAVSAMAPRWNQEREGHHMLIPYWGRPSQPWPSHCPRDPETHTRLCKDPALESRDLRSDSRLLPQAGECGAGTQAFARTKAKAVEKREFPAPHRRFRSHTRTPFASAGEGRLALVRVSGQGHRSDRLWPRRRASVHSGREVPGSRAQTRQGPDSRLGTARPAAPGCKSQPAGRGDGSSTLTAYPPVSAYVRLCLHGQAQPPKDRGPDEVAGALTRDRHQPSPLLSVSSLRGRTAVNGKP